MAQLKSGITVYLPDTRAVEISRYGKGNLKIGPNVYTYSRPAGDPTKSNPGGTCPGSTDECEAICYAKRIAGPVALNYLNNIRADVPPIPEDCKLLRLHVSGDFDSLDYIAAWIRRLKERPDVQCWAYTRSWRVPALLAGLEALRAIPNMQLFASMDSSHDDEPPVGWRRAWIDGDPRGGRVIGAGAHTLQVQSRPNLLYIEYTADGAKTLICPEETKSQPNCEKCKYCFQGQRNDVTFLRH